MKKVLLVLCALALAFGIWKFGPWVPLPVWLSMIALAMAYIGVHLTVHPPTTQKGKLFYKLSSLVLGASIIVLTWVQSYHSPPKLIQIGLRPLPGTPEGLRPDPHIRLYRLEVSNPSKTAMENICARIQLPEPILNTVSTNMPVGTAIGWRPLLRKAILGGSETRSTLPNWGWVLYPEPSLPSLPESTSAQVLAFFEKNNMTGVWELTVNRLPAGTTAGLEFLTTDDSPATNYIWAARTTLSALTKTNIVSFEKTPDLGIALHYAITATFSDHDRTWFGTTNELRYFLEGMYQYQLDGEAVGQHFLVPLAFDAGQRVVSSLQAQRDSGQWKRVLIQIF